MNLKETLSGIFKTPDAVERLAFTTEDIIKALKIPLPPHISNGEFHRDQLPLVVQVNHVVKNETEDIDGQKEIENEYLLGTCRRHCDKSFALFLGENEWISIRNNSKDVGEMRRELNSSSKPTEQVTDEGARQLFPLEQTVSERVEAV